MKHPLALVVALSLVGLATPLSRVLADDNSTPTFKGGLGLGAPEGAIAMASLMPAKQLSLDLRAFSILAFSGADIGVTVYLLQGKASPIVTGAVGVGREDAMASSDHSFAVARYAVGFTQSLSSSELRFDVGRLYMGSENGWLWTTTAVWLWQW